MTETTSAAPETGTSLTKGDLPTAADTPVRPFADVAADVLAEAIRIATGNPDAEPREGQALLFEDIADTLTSHSRIVCEAPTGSGKSFAALAPVMAAAALHGHRTVISTESLSLQDQLLHKDAPTVADACEQVLGVRPRVALQKGWSNYACLVKAEAAAKNAMPPLLSEATGTATEPDAVVAGNGSGLPMVLSWIEAQRQAHGSGEKSEFPHAMGPKDWAEVSLSSDECIGTKCPLRDECFAVRARAASQQADVVITNHATLGVQAARSASVIMGRREELRPFTHIVVDEAHGLPSAVRNAGASELSMSQLVRTSKQLESALGSGHALPDELFASLGATFDSLQRTLTDRQQCRDGFLDLDGGTLADSEDGWSAWLGQAERQGAHMAEQAEALGDVTRQAEVRRALARIETLRGTFTDIATGTDEHHAVWAKVDTFNGGRPTATICSSPVDVAAAINGNLWHYRVRESVDKAHGNWAKVDDDPVDEDEIGGPAAITFGTDEDDDPMVRRPLSVVCMSATIGAAFKPEAGVGGRNNFFAYPTPFEREFDDSAVFIPLVDRKSDAYRALLNQWKKFDVRAHARWVNSRIADKVTANGGRTLVLAARAEDGRGYVATLRAAGLQVFSQWEAPSVRWAIQQWKDHPGSTLVGTRSLMTGTDAPGNEVCTMVYIDRIARSPINALDEARTLGFLGEDDDPDDQNAMWKARAKVYAADAARLFQQAVGRLVRTSGDTGMIVVDDPRLAEVRRNPFRSADRKRYLAAIEDFGTILHDDDEALAWLAAHREKTTR